jgi:hypothetical protein
MFGHAYVSATASLMVALAVWAGEDPMSWYAEKDPAMYMSAVCGFALVLIVYGALSCFFVLQDASIFRVSHACCCCVTGILYFRMVWTPAMTDLSPTVDDSVEELMALFLQANATATGGNAAATGGDTDIEADVPLVLTILPYALISIIYVSFMLLDIVSSDEVKTDEPEKDAEKAD